MYMYNKKICVIIRKKKDIYILCILESNHYLVGWMKHIKLLYRIVNIYEKKYIYIDITTY